MEARANPGEAIRVSWINNHIWRVAVRSGRWFTIELFGFNEDLNLLELLGLDQLVPAHGPEESSPTTDQEFWKQNSQLYAIENIPFGLVSVRAPRNCRDLEAYARGRAREIIGLTAPPEHLEIDDYAKKDIPDPSGHMSDLWVHLHYHGYYED